MSSSKAIDCKGTLRQVLIRVYSLVQSVMLYFRPCFVNCCPSNLLSGSTLPPPPTFPLLKYSIQYIDSVWMGGDGGGGGREGGWLLSPVRDHILLEFKTLYLTRFRTYKIATPPLTKTYEGRGPQTDKNLPQSIFTGQFF
jgi:hypothetical protein